MTMAAVDPLFVDTNSIVYATNTVSPMHDLAPRRLSNYLETESHVMLWESR